MHHRGLFRCVTVAIWLSSTSHARGRRSFRGVLRLSLGHLHHHILKISNSFLSIVTRSCPPLLARHHFRGLVEALVAVAAANTTFTWPLAVAFQLGPSTSLARYRLPITCALRSRLGRRRWCSGHTDKLAIPVMVMVRHGDEKIFRSEAPIHLRRWGLGSYECRSDFSRCFFQMIEPFLK